MGKSFLDKNHKLHIYKDIKGSCLINMDDLNNIHHYNVDNSVHN